MKKSASAIWNAAVLVIVLVALVRAIQGWWLLMKDAAGFVKMLIKGEYHS